jgi:SRSO17 transposase
MDHYEVRTWEAWHRFITLCLLAHALLVVLRAQARADESSRCKKGMANPG